MEQRDSTIYVAKTKALISFAVEPRCEKTGLRGFRPGPTQTGLYARGLKFRIYEVEGLFYVAKTKALISFAVTAKLICVFVFAYAKSRFSHDAAHMLWMRF